MWDYVLQLPAVTRFLVYLSQPYHARAATYQIYKVIVNYKINRYGNGISLP